MNLGVVSNSQKYTKPHPLIECLVVHHFYTMIDEYIRLKKLKRVSVTRPSCPKMGRRGRQGLQSAQTHWSTTRSTSILPDT